MRTAKDERTGRLLRVLRPRADLTQQELASAAGVPVLDIRRIEAGDVDHVRLGRVRQSFTVLDARARLSIWWDGARADRLLDERHARIVERVVAVLRLRGWDVRVEVSFADYGDRGSMDVFAALPSLRAVGIFEIKSELGSLEEMNRVLDMKERLAPKVALATFGWRPMVVGRVLVLPRDMTVRRLIAAHTQTMSAIYPARSREVRAWLRQPRDPLRGIWFVSDRPNTRADHGVARSFVTPRRGDGQL